jgi:hypothetical protein
MGDNGIVLIDSSIPGDRDALYFFEEKKKTFCFLFYGTFFGLNCKCTCTKKRCYTLKLHIYVVFLQNITKLLVQIECISAAKRQKTK